MYLRGKGGGREELLRQPKLLTSVLATKLSTYPLVTISRTKFRYNTKGRWFVWGWDVGRFGPKVAQGLDVSQDGGDRGARAPQRAGRSVGRGHGRQPQGVTSQARYVV